MQCVITSYSIHYTKLYEDVTAVQSSNFVSQLSGKVAGLQVQTNSNFGGSVNILVRGSSSLTGNNQALFVVDGIPIDSYNFV